jgi:hypothetical protein
MACGFLLRLARNEANERRATWITLALLAPVIASTPFWSRLPRPAEVGILAFLDGFIVTTLVIVIRHIAAHPGRRQSEINRDDRFGDERVELR